MLPRIFILLVLIKSENTKNTFTFYNYTENPKKIYTALVLVYFLLFTFCYFILLDVLILKPCA
jgi:hypothetical protein